MTMKYQYIKIFDRVCYRNDFRTTNGDDLGTNWSIVITNNMLY